MYNVRAPLPHMYAGTHAQGTYKYSYMPTLFYHHYVSLSKFFFNYIIGRDLKWLRSLFLSPSMPGILVCKASTSSH